MYHLSSLNVKEKPMQAAHHFITTRTHLRSLFREKGGKSRSSSSSSSRFSHCPLLRVYSLLSSLPVVFCPFLPHFLREDMKTSNARPETPPSLSYPPTSSIINPLSIHYELPRSLNRSKSCSGKKGGQLRDGMGHFCREVKLTCLFM